MGSHFVQFPPEGSDEWRGFVETYGPKVWAVTRGFRLEYADACDVFQATWLNFAEHFRELKDPRRISAWLVTTAKHECIRVKQLRWRLMPVKWRPEEPEDQPHLQLLEEERDRELWAAFRTLSERCQTLLRLYVYAPEYTYAQLARAVGMRECSVGPAKRRCLERLKLRLGEL